MGGFIQASMVREDRRSDRADLGRASILRGTDGGPVAIRIDDLSVHGCGISVDVTLFCDEVINIGLPGVGLKLAQVIWIAQDRAGCAFLTPLSGSECEAITNGSNVICADFPAGSTGHGSDVMVVERAARRLGRSAVILLAACLSWSALAATAYATSKFTM